MSRVSDFSRIALGIRDTTECDTVYSIIAKTLTPDMGADNFANPREIRKKLRLQEPKAPPLAKNNPDEQGYRLLRLLSDSDMSDGRNVLVSSDHSMVIFNMRTPL